jgi:hypothetical protein
MIIRLSCREPEPLETCEVSGDVERALPMRDEPGTHWKTGLQGRPCARRREEMTSECRGRSAPIPAGIARGDAEVRALRPAGVSRAARGTCPSNG